MVLFLTGTVSVDIAGVAGSTLGSMGTSTDEKKCWFRYFIKTLQFAFQGDILHSSVGEKEEKELKRKRARARTRTRTRAKKKMKKKETKEKGKKENRKKVKKTEK